MGIIGYLDMDIQMPPIFKNVPIRKFQLAIVYSVAIFVNASLVWFLIAEASTFVQYAEVVHLLYSFVTYGSFTVLVWQKSYIIELMNDLENVIEISEIFDFYNFFNEKTNFSFMNSRNRM